jgi:hypothetical protein
MFRAEKPAPISKDVSTNISTSALVRCRYICPWRRTNRMAAAPSTTESMSNHHGKVASASLSRLRAPYAIVPDVTIRNQKYTMLVRYAVVSPAATLVRAASAIRAPKYTRGFMVTLPAWISCITASLIDGLVGICLGMSGSFLLTYGS